MVQSWLKLKQKVLDDIPMVVYPKPYHQTTTCFDKDQKYSFETTLELWPIEYSWQNYTFDIIVTLQAQWFNLLLCSCHILCYWGLISIKNENAYKVH